MSAARAPSARPPTAAGGRRPPTASGNRAPPVRAVSGVGGGGGGGGSGGRPKTGAPIASSRPGSAMARPGSSMSVAAGQFFNWVESSQGAADPQARPGSRAAARGRVGTAQGSRGGVPPRPVSRLNSAVGGRTPSVAERPVTQQGLAGVRPGSALRGLAGRQVLDKSYFMGLIRAKITDLSTEIQNITRSMEKAAEDQQNFIVYEQKAETAAKDLKLLQGSLADYNMVVDKMQTSVDTSEMNNDVEQLKSTNNIESEAVDALFADRRSMEETVRQLEITLDHERRVADSVLNDMDENIRDKYEAIREQNEQLTEDLQQKQQELSDLTTKQSDMEDELAVSPLKQQAMVLHEKLLELEVKRDAVLAEINSGGTPEEQRQRLLEKVKTDNEEIGVMERHVADVKERMEQCNDELRELEEEMHDQQGEKHQKYRELRQKEQQIDEFLATFERSRAEETARVTQLQAAVVHTLNVIAYNVARQDKTAVVTGMDDYDLAGGAAAQAKPDDAATVPDLQDAHVRLQEEMIRVGELEQKARDEIHTLRSRIDEMQSEMATFADLDTLKTDAEARRLALQREREALEKQKEWSRSKAAEALAEVSSMETALDQSDAHVQVVNLEKKLQYVEQNNFALRDAIEGRLAETDVAPVKEQVLTLLTEHNQHLIQLAAGRGNSATRPG